mgnify:CR=1 FL=1
MGKQKLIIALDGHSSCGKSTYAKLIAAELGYSYIDTGAMYRAVTLAAMEAGLFEDTDAPPYAKIEALLKNVELSLKHNPEKQRTEIFMNGRMVEDLIRRMEVSAHVSYIAAISAVRRKMVEYQRKLGQKKGVVMDGRDIGTVVFPDAEHRFYLDASAEERSRRRHAEMQDAREALSVDDVKDSLSKRDQMDSTRKVDPLRVASGATIIDSTGLSIDQVVEKVLSICQ